jgi:competence protein ComEA
MDLIGEERGRLARAATWLEATRAETVGLAVLVAGAVLATVVFAWTALGTDTTAATSPAATAGLTPGSDAHDHDAGPAAAHDSRAHPADGPDADADADAEVADAEVTVHVAGAVHDPGVVTLDAGSRVVDAIAAAGGLVADADPTGVNLARPLTDGERVHVLREGEDPPPAIDAPTGGAAGTGGDAGGTSTDGELVDLNRASVAELESLPGIGPAIAQRIVDHREQHGPFRQPGDLRDVSGIGEKRFQDLADRVTVG